MLTKIYKKAFVVIIICISIYVSINLIFDIWWQRKCDSPLNYILAETEEIPAYILWGELHLGDSSINIKELCRENHYILNEVLCVRNETVYFVCEVPYENFRCLALGKVSLENSDVQIFYKMPELSPREGYPWYRPAFVKEYKERNAYCYNGQIVLNVQEVVVVYDIDSDTIQRYGYNDYKFPERIGYGECIDSHTIVLHVGDTVSEYTLKDMAAASAGISQLYALKEQKIYDRATSYIYDLFSTYSSVQCTEDKIYVIGRCVNYTGSSGAVILEYDIEEDTWIYVIGKHIPLGQNIHMECYVIPCD